MEITNIAESQNVKAKGECSLAQYNNKASCTGHSGTWSTSSHHIDPPYDSTL